MTEPDACYGLGPNKGSSHCPNRASCDKFDVLGTKEGYVIAGLSQCQQPDETLIWFRPRRHQAERGEMFE